LERRHKRDPKYDRAVDLYKSGMSVREIASIFGITHQAMWKILRRRIELRPQKQEGEVNEFYRGYSYSSRNASHQVEFALKRGEIKRPDKCESCGQKGTPNRIWKSTLRAHHDNYNKPLEVRWLCYNCHYEWHKNNTPIPAKEDNNEAS
jgi:hypothetical protein